MVPGRTFRPPKEPDPRAAPHKPRWVDAGGAIEFRSPICPLPMVDRQTNELLNLWRWWKDKVLPRAGGLFDQPNFYLEAMKIIDQRFDAMVKEDT